MEVPDNWVCHHSRFGWQVKTITEMFNPGIQWPEPSGLGPTKIWKFRTAPNSDQTYFEIIRTDQDKEILKISDRTRIMKNFKIPDWTKQIFKISNGTGPTSNSERSVLRSGGPWIFGPMLVTSFSNWDLFLRQFQWKQKLIRLQFSLPVLLPVEHFRCWMALYCG